MATMTAAWMLCISTQMYLLIGEQSEDTVTYACARQQFDLIYCLIGPLMEIMYLDRIGSRLGTDKFTGATYVQGVGHGVHMDERFRSVLRSDFKVPSTLSAWTNVAAELSSCFSY